MRKSRYQITESAERDMEDIWDWMAGYSFDSANALQDEIMETIHDLGAFVRIGRKRSELRIGLRSFPVRERYLVFYEMKEKGIIVLRVMHTARDIRPEDFGGRYT